MSGIRWTDEELYAYLARTKRKVKAPANLAVSSANPKRNEALSSQATNQNNQVDKKFRVIVHHRSRRATDFGGRDYKAAIDGITDSGIWPDDSLRYVQEIRETYKRGPTDETVIEVWEIE